MDVNEKLIEILKIKYDHFCDQCSINKDSKCARCGKEIETYFLKEAV